MDAQLRQIKGQLIGIQSIMQKYLAMMATKAIHANHQMMKM